MNELLVEDRDGVRIITFNRPEVKNALTFDMRAELCDLVLAADDDSAIAGIVITGVDPVFTAGVDFKERHRGTDPKLRPFNVNPGSALRSIRTPSVCAVNGACVSGGLEIALSATFVVASDRARFADTHARLNVVPAWGLTALLPRAVGLRKARELSLTGNFVDAVEASRIGLVNHVVAHDELLPFTLALVHQFTDAPAAATVLDLYDRGTDLGLDAAIALETATVSRMTFDVDSFTARGRDAAARQRDTLRS